MPRESAGPVVQEVNAYGLARPWGVSSQYTKVFESLAQFHAFQRELEELNSGHKRWLNVKVRLHLNLIQGYIAWITRRLVLLQRTELPGEPPLHGEAYEKAARALPLMQGLTKATPESRLACFHTYGA